ncbi:MAG: TniQ family protein [Nostoc sp. ChiSLP02]|nr:TniQ family protein [Nostoc sp. DedSLP05]MDZ8102054.1 TniQ family protein [Nostoc sp. DedSLP01]MDZ8189275.1 TniQ family protein [Nostoc sp. ChiSLP02]
MEIGAEEPRVFEVEPLNGESLSHFLGRFRRENYLTSSQLGKLTGLGAVILRWEKLYLNPFPTRQELEALASVVRVDADRLTQMLSSKGVTMKPRPIRLCAACYAEQPCHRIEWQFKEKMKCDRHNLGLLTKCTNCETPFPIPADWLQGECLHCFLPFATMAKRQKPR